MVLVVSGVMPCFVTSAHPVEPKRTEGCATPYNPQHDYFPDKVSPQYARGFTVSYHKHYKQVKVIAPWEGAKTVFNYVLAQCGAPLPTEVKDAQVIRVPARRLLVLSSAYLGFVEQLGLPDQVIGVDWIRYVNTPSLVERIRQGKIVELGANVEDSLERIVALDPDLIITYGTGDSYLESYAPLLRLGIRVALFAEYRETIPLGRAEWLKFLALFVNQEALANQVFVDIERQYQTLLRLTQKVTHKPTVMVGMDYQGTWYVPGGKSFMATFLKDAGADYLWAGNESRANLFLDFEKVYAHAAKAEYWLHPGAWKSRTEALAQDSRYTKFAAFQQGRVYNNNARLNPEGGNDYWESGVGKPHLVLADLIKIFHPELVPQHQLIWHQALP